MMVTYIFTVMIFFMNQFKHSSLSLQHKLVDFLWIAMDFNNNYLMDYHDNQHVEMIYMDPYVIIKKLKGVIIISLFMVLT